MCIWSVGVSTVGVIVGAHALMTTGRAGYVHTVHSSDLYNLNFAAPVQLLDSQYHLASVRRVIAYLFQCGVSVYGVLASYACE